MSPKETAYIVERLAVRFMSMVADYERKLVEHRDAFGVRTSADAKIIDGMRAEVEDLRSRLNALGIQAAKQAGEALGITGLFDDTKITVRREPDQNHGSRIVISDANDMGEANIYLTESGARQMATALIGLFRKTYGRNDQSG